MSHVLLVPQKFFAFCGIVANRINLIIFKLLLIFTRKGISCLNVF